MRKSRQEAHAAIQKAVQLTTEQQAKKAEIAVEVKATRQELQQKVMDILTPEQKALLNARRQAKKKNP